MAMINYVKEEENERKIGDGKESYGYLLVHFRLPATRKQADEYIKFVSECKSVSAEFVPMNE